MPLLLLKFLFNSALMQIVQAFVQPSGLRNGGPKFFDQPPAFCNDIIGVLKELVLHICPLFSLIREGNGIVIFLQKSGQG